MRKFIIVLMLFVFGLPSVLLATNQYGADEMFEESSTQQKMSKYSFKDLENLEGADVVFVSKMMLSMAKGFVPDMSASGVDMKRVMKDLTGVHIISIENKASVKKALFILANLLKGDNYEVMMKMKEAGSDDVTFYYKESKTKGESEFLMVTNEGGEELSIIRLKGNINLEKLQGLTK